MLTDTIMVSVDALDMSLIIQNPLFGAAMTYILVQ